MKQQHKKVVMRVTMLTAGKAYEAHHLYSVPASFAAQLVREKSAKYVRASAADAEPDRTWRATVRDGDSFPWQVTVELPNLVQPRIFARYDTPPRARRTQRRRHLSEVGGDGGRVSPNQSNAIDYLLKNEAIVYRRLLGALAAYAEQCRTDWNLDDRIAPKKMTAGQVSQRVAFDTIYVTRRARDGVAYLEISGECAWDREHGFTIVMHRQRVVEVMQQGAGWADRRPAKGRAV